VRTRQLSVGDRTATCYAPRTHAARSIRFANGFSECADVLGYGCACDSLDSVGVSVRALFTRLYGSQFLRNATIDAVRRDLRRATVRMPSEPTTQT
jgi:hypothetical protein